MSDTLYAAYNSDDNYAPYLGASMLSLLQSNTSFSRICIYIMDCGMTEESRCNLRHIAARFGREIFFVPMQQHIAQLDLHLGAHKMAVAAYARLFLTQVLPEDCSRVLYIDCDTIVKGSLAEIWKLPFGNALIAGVQDTVDNYFLTAIGLEKGLPYINAGILLVNLEAWRKENLLAQFLGVIRRFDGNVPAHDQGTINAVCGARRIVLPVRYNLTSNLYSFSAKTIRRIYFLDSYYSQNDLDAAIADPAIVHFTTGLLGRPWEEGSTHPERQVFLDALAATPWGALPLQPDSRYFGLKCFTFFYEHCPRGLFEFLYRNLCWMLHLRK